MCNLINTHTHTHTQQQHGEEDTPMLGYADARQLWVESTQEGQIPYLSGDVPVECVGFMPVSLTAVKCPGTVFTGAQREPAQVEPLGAQPSQERSQPHLPSQNQTQFICPLCPREKTYHGTAASVAGTNTRFTLGRGKSFLKNSGGRYKRHAA